MFSKQKSVRKTRPSINGSTNSMLMNGSSDGHGPPGGRLRHSGSLHSSTTKMNRSKWKRARKARREAKVVQKSAAHVDKIVQELTEGLPFLLSTPNQPIAKFHRTEIVVGNLLGRGVFARVYEVKDFDLHDVDEEEELHLSQQLQHTRLSPQEQIIQELGGGGPDFDDESSSGSSQNVPQQQGGQIGTIDEMPLGAIAESDSDEDDYEWDPRQRESQQQQLRQGRQQRQQIVNGGGESSTDTTHNGDDGTSSTAPISAPSTPPLTPASTGVEESTAVSNNRSRNARTGTLRGSLPPSGRGAAIGGSLRYSSTNNYQRNLLTSSQKPMDQPSLRIHTRDVLRKGQTGYALKHLTKTLLRNPKDFYLAAAALLVEAKYLSKLNHPNIIKVTGLAMSGNMMEEATKGQHRDTKGDHSRQVGGGLESSPQHDSYFLISERLTDTLDRRIRQWRRDEGATPKKLSERTSSQKIQAWKHMIRKTSYALQMSNALSYMHERNLLYRDLKPQNIGFIGDNQTIALFNFGLCRELNPITLKVREDAVTELYGALSWRYTAVECFPQPVVTTPAQLVATSTRFLQNHSSRSFGLDSISSSARGGKTKKIQNLNDDISINELERELRAVHEKIEKEGVSAANKDNAPRVSPPRPALPDDRKTNLECVHMVKASYDVKVDVYSWAMVYYEMLTMNQPFSGMTQKEHLRKVAGPKGGQRPGVYQFDLTPSMISLLQRAWDQNPKKRPTMESVGRNLQLILRELELLIKAEQKTLLKAAGGTEEAVAALTSREERAARRAKLREEAAAKKSSSQRAGRKSSIMQVVRSKADGLFAKNKYRRGDFRERPGNSIPGLPNIPSTPGDEQKRDSTISAGEIDVDALGYEAWSSDDDDDDNSLSLESEDPSSLTDHFGETGGTRDNAPAENTEVEIPVIVEEEENEEGSDADVVGDAISAFRSKKSRSPPSRDRNLSSHSGAGGSRLRRKTKSESMKARRHMMDTFSFERRGTSRMSRRTMRLSRASVWMMRRDVRVFLIVLSVLMTVAFGGAAWKWYKKRQRTWLGVDLELLGQHNMSNAREILESAIADACRHEVASERNHKAPMLFQGGALSPVDTECIETLRRQLDEKLARVTGVPLTKTKSAHVGFLNLQRFDRPPPQPKKSRWRRKKPWKFFRESERTGVSDETELVADQSRVGTLDKPDQASGRTKETCNGDVDSECATGLFSAKPVSVSEEDEPDDHGRKESNEQQAT